MTITETSNIRQLPLSIRTNKEVIQDALNSGCIRAKVILTKTIVLGHWVKLQCQYGCPFYGKLYTCPPHTPTSDEMADILLDYHKALLILTGQDSHLLNLVVGLEEKFKSKGFYKAFALCSHPCDLCEVCTLDTQCKFPEKTRPTVQACGIDMQGTVLKNGWGDLSPIHPCATDCNIGLVLLD
ncbi:MAG: DUF2284 domain-containing protein [Nitrospinaceae bacterium]